MAFPKIICLKQMIILGVDLIDVGQAEEEQEREREAEWQRWKIKRVRMVKNIHLCQLDSKRCSDRDFSLSLSGSLFMLSLFIWPATLSFSPYFIFLSLLFWKCGSLCVFASHHFKSFALTPFSAAALARFISLYNLQDILKVCGLSQGETYYYITDFTDRWARIGLTDSY